MPPSSSSGEQDGDAEPLRPALRDPNEAPASAATEPAATDSALSTPELIERLQADRLWLLRQIDAGLWPQWRLDLAALERELGQLLDQASERFPAG
ncbi:MAG: hypothetical protein VKJ66_00195 [Synechococcus sp.]|nr:hypothetical protein [Synechococcus sp.]